MLADDFDYPMPKRETNWTLKNDQKGPTAAKLSQRPPRAVNTTSDIDGARTGTTSLYRSRQFANKPSLYATADIAGAAPAQQIPKTVNKPNDRHVHNHDIEHSYPESKLFSTPRTVDPLNPTYKLPEVRKKPPTPPVQRTETMKIHDIEGTKTKPLWRRSEVRNPLDYSDVPLSHAGGRAELRKRKTESMMLTTQDIMAVDHRITNRRVSPLDPEYTVTGPSGKKEVLGPIDGAKPKSTPNQRRDRPLMSLRSDDIPGSRPGSHVPYPAESKRRGWKKTCDVSDIDTRGKRSMTF